MKKIISLTLVCVLLICSMFVLASCAKTLNGTYENNGAWGIGASSLSFETDGSVVYTIGSASFTGTYEIVENKETEKLEIVFDFGTEEATALDALDGAKSFTEGEENGVDFITIGGVKFTKAK